MNQELQVSNLAEKTLEAIQSIPDAEGNFVKINKAGGFELNGQPLQTIRGTITDIRPYLLKFQNGQPEKLPNVTSEAEIPEGFSRRCDITIRSGSQEATISLPPSSLRALKTYLVNLTGRNLSPDQIVTEFGTATKKGNFGPFAVVTFRAAGPASQPQTTVTTPAPVQQQVIPSEPAVPNGNIWG